MRCTGEIDRLSSNPDCDHAFVMGERADLAREPGRIARLYANTNAQGVNTARAAGPPKGHYGSSSSIQDGRDAA